MSQQQLVSRFLREHRVPRPDIIIVCTALQTAADMVAALLDAHEIFTVEPSMTGRQDEWRIGVQESARPVATWVAEQYPEGEEADALAPADADLPTLEELFSLPTPRSEAPSRSLPAHARRDD